MFWPISIFAVPFLVAAIAGAYLWRCLTTSVRSWAEARHRPHRDPDWHARAPFYQAGDPGKRTLLSRLLWRVARKAPFGAKMIWRHGTPYMTRVYLTPWWAPQIYLHRILMSDDGVHNHPNAWCCSFLIEGSYREDRTTPYNHTYQSVRKRWVNYIPAEVFHAIELDRGPVWSLFVCGPRDRDWGFLNDDGTVTLSQNRQIFTGAQVPPGAP